MRSKDANLSHVCAADPGLSRCGLDDEPQQGKNGKKNTRHDRKAV